MIKITLVEKLQFTLIKYFKFNKITKLFSYIKLKNQPNNTFDLLFK
jgi:hypothetical protein